MAALGQPPRVKILEALGAIADGRVKLIDDKHAIVTSSEGDKRYRVYIDLSSMEAYSDDNGTKLRGYVGYPIIAVMMLRGFLPFNEKVANALKGIRWKRLNETYKRYVVVEKVVKQLAAKRGVSSREIDAFVAEVMKSLRGIRLRLRSPD